MKAICALLLLCALLAVGCAAAEEAGYVLTEDGYMRGTLKMDGDSLQLDALFDGDVPPQLRHITLRAAELTHAQVRAAIDAFFTVGEEFDHKWGTSPRGTFRFYSLVGNIGPSRHAMTDYHEISAGIQDEALAEAVSRCKAMLDSLGIRYYPIPNLASYGVVNAGWSTDAVTQEEAARRGKLHHAVVLSLLVEDVMLPPGYTGNLGSPDGVNGSRVLIDDPTASFTFDEQGRLTAFSVSAYAVKEAQDIPGQVMPWQEALRIWYRDLMSDPTAKASFARHTLRVTRIQYVWLTSFRNVLRPGWYFECVPILRETGAPDETRWMPGIGVDAITGEL